MSHNYALYFIKLFRLNRSINLHICFEEELIYTVMAYKQNYEGSQEWLDDISRFPDWSSDSETTSSSGESKGETNDEDFYGFKGLDYNNLHLYRVLREEESIINGIFCQDKDSNRTVEQHIASGSKYKSKFISTTLSLNVATLWAYYDMKTKVARVDPLRIVEIYIQVLAGTQYEKKCINLCDKEVREHFIKGNTHRSWAKSSEEVLFVEKIPKFVTSADEVNTSASYYAQATFVQQPSLPQLMSTLTIGSNLYYEAPKMVFQLKTNISKPKTPSSKT
ncbi:uncharacterized protein LOC132759702 [Ruditapes philippinarum]|uniref:uncharacterized protein LOC132759702 n=1 Tax=Ruditapes philippinarum TaxID=129788 RepID=UPI00295B7AC7|nr:uncharacterized protein LOC132759702 [Ruditapes philippinarum]